ncbi:hypothetical protein HR060_12385 [Catenovulum sp. SM1970]|uniref:hypothetical protein n=1 Tax=Marinifaba aquimaris TaxID=2741323 RepID=UPI001574CCE6|nr:hypothetical protein [Marinifaba aquimaris]NTS77658.1 hypothetical protein [Marinifaba aquimaris]
MNKYPYKTKFSFTDGASDSSSTFIVVVGALTSIICFAAGSAFSENGEQIFGYSLILVCVFWLINFFGKRYPAFHFINSVIALGVALVSCNLGIKDFLSDDYAQSAAAAMYLIILLYTYGVAMFEFKLGNKQYKARKAELEGQE